MFDRSNAEMPPGWEGLLGPRVLLVEDHAEVAAAIRLTLQRAGMHTAWANNGAEALTAVAEFKPEIVLVDLELPDTNGVPLIRWLVTNTACGVIVVSGHLAETDRIICLECGADDYICKPAMPRDLVARIRAVHRRISTLANGARCAPRRPAIAIGTLSIDLQQRMVTAADGTDIKLTAAEFAILAALIDARGAPVSREFLSQQALRKPWRAEDRSIDQLILGLRRRLIAGDDGLRLIQSVRNAGYLICLPEAVADIQEMNCEHLYP